MKQETRVIAWFDEVTKCDISLVGGKGANLGEMVHAQIPVPNGFIVTSDAYIEFLEDARITDEIRNCLQTLDVDDNKKLQHISALIINKISNSTMPDKIARGIQEAYCKLGEGLVAVRSSATAEDLPNASFAGQQRTFLNIQGKENVVTAVQRCWASLFESRAIFYRHQQGFDYLTVGIAVE